jgi:pSer/pThr/pTyr-binding forkhead associated (FHA) protein
MAKLVVLSPDQKGRSYELKVDKTTIGRVEDNTFQIAESSVSSHHCEVLLRGTDVVIKDLNSTNGSFINGEKISESVLKPGQTLRLGQIELRLETGDSTTSPPAPSAPAAPTPAPGPGAAPAAGGPKRQMDQTVVMKRGVSLDELEQGTRTSGFDTSSKGFSKKSNKTNRWFLVGGIIVVVLVGIVFLYILSTVGGKK